jgi:DNA-directed RNA polymerase subunit RPC12/RpoP
LKNISFLSGKSMEISMENSKEKCPQCGKKVKFLKKHIKRVHLSMDNSGKIPGKVQEISMENSKEKIPSFLKEINLQGEFNKMADVINPKKEEPKEAKYECGSCHQKFNDKYKRCPHCGVEFE